MDDAAALGLPEPHGPAALPDGAADVGDAVVVRNRYLGEWCGGFAVTELLPDGYRIMRVSDGHTFPDVFSFDDVRRDRRRRSAPWNRPDLSRHRGGDRRPEVW